MIPSRWTLRRLRGHFFWLRRKKPPRPLVATHTHTQAAVPFHVGTWHANDVSRGAWRVRAQLFLKETGTFLVTSFCNFDVWSLYNLCSRVPPGEHMSWKQQLLKDPWRMKTGTCWKDQKLPLLIVLRCTIMYNSLVAWPRFYHCKFLNSPSSNYLLSLWTSAPWKVFQKWTCLDRSERLSSLPDSVSRPLRKLLDAESKIPMEFGDTNWSNAPHCIAQGITCSCDSACLDRDRDGQDVRISSGGIWGFQDSRLAILRVACDPARSGRGVQDGFIGWMDLDLWFQSLDLWYPNRSWPQTWEKFHDLPRKKRDVCSWESGLARATGTVMNLIRPWKLPCSCC